VEHIVDEDDGTVPYGTKMAKLMGLAGGEYISSVDDDDVIAPDYVESILRLLESGPSVATFAAKRIDAEKVWTFHVGVEDGVKVTGGEIMCANHFCAWRADWAKTVPWLPAWYGVDVFWYKTIAAAYAPLTEAHINKVLYIYKYDPAITACQTPLRCKQSLDLMAGGVSSFRRRSDGLIVAATHGWNWQVSHFGEDSVEVVDSDGNVSVEEMDSMDFLATGRI
jgi:hypothetical protein